MLAAFLVPFITMTIYYLIFYNYLGVHKFIALVDSQHSWVPRIKLCVYTNLVPFYLFLQFNLYRSVRGVILTTLMWAAFIIYLMLAS